MICALVNRTTMLVDNIIMADPAVDPNPCPGTHLFIPAPTDFFIEIGTPYHAVNGFTKPGAAPIIQGLKTL